MARVWSGTIMPKTDCTHKGYSPILDLRLVSRIVSLQWIALTPVSDLKVSQFQGLHLATDYFGDRLLLLRSWGHKTVFNRQYCKHHPF